MANVDTQTEQATRKILTYWYGSVAEKWKINDKTVAATAALLSSPQKCSKINKAAMHSSTGVSGIGVMTRLSCDSAKRIVSKAAAHNTYYNTRIRMEAMKKRSAIEATKYY